ncbi:hypothetical protein RhiirA4_471915 [Rhizophagus irregularis]|uniref:Uncharacterized protein n=1 Tax=Rhizophagus irregularis TaxID=588596 RepID=A0A2I1H403_9GLOM|nr:hypothetical protein RhiirA4_471915 [Rhizophagus irregularis]
MECIGRQKCYCPIIKKFLKKNTYIENIDNFDEENSTKDEVKWADVEIKYNADKLFQILRKNMKSLKSSKHPLWKDLNNKNKNVNDQSDIKLDVKSIADQIENKLKNEV